MRQPAVQKKNSAKGRVVITNYKFVLRKDTKRVFAADAVGTVCNIGNCAVKHLVIVGYCPSCKQVLLNGQWFSSDNTPPTANEEGIIDYLPAGATATFRVRDVALIMPNTNQTVSTLPDKMGVRILSFKAVQ